MLCESVWLRINLLPLTLQMVANQFFPQQMEEREAEEEKNHFKIAKSLSNVPASFQRSEYKFWVPTGWTQISFFSHPLFSTFHFRFRFSWASFRVSSVNFSPASSSFSQLLNSFLCLQPFDATPFILSLPPPFATSLSVCSAFSLITPLVVFLLLSSFQQIHFILKLCSIPLTIFFYLLNISVYFLNFLSSVE